MNLTKTSQYFKVGLKVLLGFAFLYYLVVFFIYPQAKTIIRNMTKQRNPANVAYGMLDQLEFVEKPINGSMPSYVLNTPNGSLPDNLPYKMAVYKTQKPQFSYLAGTNAINDAAFIGFNDNDLVTDLKGTEYKWKSLDTGSVLDIDINSRVLTMTTVIPSNANNLDTGNINQINAVTEATTLFQKLNRIDDTYINGTTVVTLGKVLGTELSTATDQREAQIAKVDFFRKIGKYPVATPDPQQALLSATVKNLTQTSPLNYPEIQAYYWPIETPPTADYPIIEVSDAWNAVKNGKGVIAGIVPKESNPFADYTPVRVETIYMSLAYYETPKQQTILQPIYVFKGFYTTSGTTGGDITIYFPAITSTYIKH
jgi:hypothetical protein